MLNFNFSFEPGAIQPTQEQKDAIKLAAQNWGSLFADTATIDLTVKSISNRFDTTAMSARNGLSPTAMPGFGNIEVIRTKVLTGKDINGAKRDGQIEINWAKNWELDFNEVPDKATQEVDFYATFYHELNHALGLSSQISTGGFDPYNTLFGPGSWAAYDKFLTDGQGNSVIGSDGRVISDYRNLLKGGSSKDNRSGLFFSGPNAKAANGGKSVGLYTPETIMSGSSGSHLDDENPELADSLMLAEITAGPGTRSLSDIEKGILKDLGYTFANDTSPSLTPDVPNAEKSPVEITTLGDGNTIALQVEKMGISEVSELLIFRSDDASGKNRKEIGNFSLLAGGQLPSKYAPLFTVEKDEVSVGKFLDFEIVEKGETRFATPVIEGNDKVMLDFGGGTVLSFQPATESSTTNVLLDDAATIDLSSQSGVATLDFSVYREATFNNTVGFYETDTADGAIITDSLTGERVRPGEAGYKEAALARQLDTRLTGENGKVSTFSAEILSSSFIGTFLVADSTDLSAGELYFSHASANANNNDHVKMLGNNTFGFEDLAGLGDKDFNDVVVQFDIA